mgnify:CR=1 FL=1
MAFGNMPRWDWLLIIPLVAVFSVFNVGLTLITARLTVHFRDLTQLLPFVSRFFFYTSGTFFSVERRFGENETIMAIAMTRNPAQSPGTAKNTTPSRVNLKT